MLVYTISVDESLRFDVPKTVFPFFTVNVRFWSAPTVTVPVEWSFPLTVFVLGHTIEKLIPVESYCGCRIGIEEDV